MGSPGLAVRSRLGYPRVLVALVIPVFLANAALLGPQLADMIGSSPEADWRALVEASLRVWSGGDLFGQSDAYAYRWSPLFAAAFVPFAWLGLGAWRVLHVAALLALPNRRTALVSLVLWPFWFDVATGNVMTFVMVLAARAIRGQRWAVGAYLALALLIPRPVVAPVALWLLIRQPWARLPTAIAGMAQLFVVAGMGWLGPWIGRLLTSAGEMDSPFNLAPSRFLGWWWLPIGLGLAAVAWRLGRPALAGVLATPYCLPYYLLMPLADHAARPLRLQGPTPAPDEADRFDAMRTRQSAKYT